jgi:hypothetical protein
LSRFIAKTTLFLGQREWRFRTLALFAWTYQSWYNIFLSQQISEQYFSAWLFSEANRAHQGTCTVIVKRIYNTMLVKGNPICIQPLTPIIKYTHSLLIQVLSRD